MTEEELDDIARELGLNMGRQHLLKKTGMEPLLNSEIKDIMMSNYQKIVREFTNDDLTNLAQFMNLPRKDDNTIDPVAAREQLETFLKTNPTFLSRSPAKVCSNIAYYFTLHKVDVEPPPQPNWIRKFRSAPTSPVRQVVIRRRDMNQHFQPDDPDAIPTPNMFD